MSAHSSSFQSSSMPHSSSSPLTPSMSMISSGSPYNPISLDHNNDDSADHHHNHPHHQELIAPPSVRRSQGATTASAALYIREANRLVARHQQHREAQLRTNKSFEIPSSVSASAAISSTPPRPSQQQQQLQRSRSATPNSKLARYSLPSAVTSVTSNNNNSPASASTLRQQQQQQQRQSWNHPSSTRSAPSLDNDSSSSFSSSTMKLQALRVEHEKLQESHLVLEQENKLLHQQTDEFKTKTLALEARLLDSMQARSKREQKFQEEMKRQRASMHSLFTELADSKREAEMLKKELKDTFMKLQLQQALTANIAFQQEQEELEYRMEQEQFRKQQQQQQQQGGALPPSAETAVYDPRDGEELRPNTTVIGNNTRDPGFSRLGNFFTLRRAGGQGAGPMNAAAASNGASSSAAAALSLAASKSSSELGHFSSYEESKNDLFEQLHQDSYGSDVHKLFEAETTSTVTTEDSSSNPAASRFMLPSEDYLKATPTTTAAAMPPPQVNNKKSFSRRNNKTKTPQEEEEMNYGQTSASMPPAAPMSRLDRIRQKRRNLEAMFRHNGASAAVVPTSSSSKNNKQSLAAPPPPRGRANYQAKTSSSRNNNHHHHQPHRNLVNLMNHRRHDD